MLVNIASVYGGQVNIDETKTGPFVLWVINDRKIIQSQILPLFARFPPLTTRVTLQLAFMLKAMRGMSIVEYLSTRGEKYGTRAQILPLFTVIPPYFSS